MSAEVAESRPTITYDGNSLGEVFDFNMSGAQVEVIPTSHYDTTIPTAANEIGSDTFIASQHVDAGVFNMQIHLNPDTVIKLGGDAKAMVVQFAPSGGDVTGAKIEYDAFFTSEDMAFPFKGKMVRTINGKITGTRTHTPGAAS